MNYLAHIFLAEDNYESRIGNFLGDFVKGRLKNQYTDGIIKGIKTHRKVDAFTDSHQIVRDTRDLISPGRRRWAGVMLDIFFDHFLSKNWSCFTNADPDEFISVFYADLKTFNNSDLNDLGFDFGKIIRNDWIRKYRSIDGLKLIFSGLSKRVNVQNPLYGSESELVKNYDQMENQFMKFFPELIDYVENWRNGLC